MLRKIIILFIVSTYSLFAQQTDCSCDVKNNNIQDYKNFVKDYFENTNYDSLKYRKIRVELIKKVCGENSYQYAEALYNLCLKEWNDKISFEKQSNIVNPFGFQNSESIIMRSSFLDDLEKVIKILDNCNLYSNQSILLYVKSLKAKAELFEELQRITFIEENIISENLVWLFDDGLALAQMSLVKILNGEAKTKKIDFYENIIGEVNNEKMWYNIYDYANDLTYSIEYHLLNRNFEKANKVIAEFIKLIIAEEPFCNNLLGNDCFVFENGFYKKGKLFYNQGQVSNIESVNKLYQLLKAYDFNYYADLIIIKTHGKLDKTSIDLNKPFYYELFANNINLINKSPNFGLAVLDLVKLIIEKKDSFSINEINLAGRVLEQIKFNQTYRLSIREIENINELEKRVSEWLINIINNKTTENIEIKRLQKETQDFTSFNKFVEDTQNTIITKYDSTDNNWLILKNYLKPIKQQIDQSGISSTVAMSYSGFFYEDKDEIQYFFKYCKYDSLRSKYHFQNLTYRALEILSKKTTTSDSINNLINDYREKIIINSNFEDENERINNIQKLEIVRILIARIVENFSKNGNDGKKEQEEDAYQTLTSWINILGRLNEKEIKDTLIRNESYQFNKFKRSNTEKIINTNFTSSLGFLQFINTTKDYKLIEIQDLQKKLNEDEAILLMMNSELEDGITKIYIVTKYGVYNNELTSEKEADFFFFRDKEIDEISQFYNYSFGAITDNIYKELEINKIKKVFFMSSGYWNQMPIPYLKTSSSKRLFEYFDFEKIYNINQFLNRDGNEPQINISRISLFGYPSYKIDTTSWRNEVMKVTKNEKFKSKYKNYWFRDSTLVQEYNKIDMLPGTLEEVNFIDSLFLQDSNVKINKYIENQAIEENVYEQETIKPNILHIATHGKVTRDTSPWSLISKLVNPAEYLSQFEALTQVLLTGAEISLNARDSIYFQYTNGLLGANEIKEMDLSSTDLVVLSACQSGLGESTDVDGVFGFPRAFKIAGAKHVMYSLWNISDTVTSEFMSVFYKYLKSSKQIIKSFNDTQRFMATKYPDDPFYWAGFQLL